MRKMRLQEGELLLMDVEQLHGAVTRSPGSAPVHAPRRSKQKAPHPPATYLLVEFLHRLSLYSRISYYRHKLVVFIISFLFVFKEKVKS